MELVPPPPRRVFLLLIILLAAVISQPITTLHAEGHLLRLTSDDGHHGDHHSSTDQLYGVDGVDDDVPRLYIVQLLPPPQLQHGGRGVLKSGAEEEEEEEVVEAWYRSFLPATHLLDSGKPRMVHSYRKAICGFAAWLTPREVEAMRGMEGFVGAQLDRPLEPATTHTPKFLRLENGTGLWRQTRWGDGRHIGIVDGGFDPDHVSFVGAGMKPPLIRLRKGTCDFKCDYPVHCTCTNKVLGAATFKLSGLGPEHGTMCASIAAGDFVGDAGDADHDGYAEGIASGASPKSYLSFYLGTDLNYFVLVMDRAIVDRVNVLSISLGNSLDTDYPDDYLAVATFAAVEHGIVVVMAAGNRGPDRGTVVNNAPWLLTVGASTHDRAAEMSLVIIETMPPDRVEYHNFYGVTQCELKKFDTNTFPLLYPGEGSGGSFSVRTCNETLGGKDALGAVVLCWRHPSVSPIVQAKTVKDARGRAMVLMNDGTTWGDDLTAVPYLHFSTVVMKHSDSNTIVQILEGSKKNMGDVTALIQPSGSRFNTRPTPVVADFSSRGPNQVTESILKPDILGPGVNILAAKAGSKDKFLVESGTSLATPHLAGVAALVKSRHPGWSPAAIRSAIMTTANVTDNEGNLITDHTGKAAGFYAAGAGLVNPRRADDPGLVYDIADTTDYLRVLCSMYPQDRVNMFAAIGRNVDCAVLGTLQPDQLNYPSIAMTLGRGMGLKKVVHRTVTNVGPAVSEYRCSLEGVPTRDVRVSVVPCLLAFTRRREQLSFTVQAELVPGTAIASGTVVEGYLRWTSRTGRHMVTSPLVLVVP